MEDKEFIDGGFFLTPRKLFDSDVWRNVHKARLFLLLIGRANHQKDKPQRLGGVSVAYGQYLRSYRKLAEDLDFVENRQIKRPSLSSVKRWVDELVSEDRIAVLETELGTLFTVKKYRIYQGFSSYARGTWNSTLNSDGTVTEQPRNNNKHSKHSEHSKPPPLLPEDEEVVFENEFFTVKKAQIDEWKKSYPFIKKFHPHLTRVSDVLLERTRMGENVRSAIAFLHSHLERENEKLRRKPDIAFVPLNEKRNSEPLSLEKILEGALRNNGQE